MSWDETKDVHILCTLEAAPSDIYSPACSIPVQRTTGYEKKVSVNIHTAALTRARKINFLDFFTAAADASLFYHLCRWLLCVDSLCYCGTQFGSGSAESESFKRIEFSGASPAASFPPRTGWYSKWSGVEVHPDSLKRFDRRSVKLNKWLINTRKLSESVCDTWAAQ